MMSMHEHRVARVDDAESIARLHIASWRDVYRAVLPAAFLDRLDLDARRAVWAAQLTEPGAMVLLAESASDLIGFCACGPTRDADSDPGVCWEIYNFHVTPHLRGRGVGGELFSEALQRGLAAGCRMLTLWVVAENAAARRFYARQGMLPDGATQNETVGPGAVLYEVRYRKALLAL